MEKMKFNVEVKDIEFVNPLVSKCKVYVMYTGKNRNKSIIEKSVVEDALPTIFGIPIIGEYNESIEDFKGHGGKIEISDEGIKYIHTTKPYGYIPENSEITWETIVEDGVSKEYLVCTGYLWTGRYPECTDVINSGKSQSMEIDDVEGNFTDEQYFNIKSFIFSALCILGDEVEPCFEGASVVAYSLNKDDFKAEFDEMIKEIKCSFNQPIASVGDEKLGGENLENLENANFKNENLDPNSENENLENGHTEFQLTNEQLREEIRRELYSQTYETEWGYKENKFYYVDSDDSLIYAKDYQGGGVLVAFGYSINGDKVVVDFESSKRMKISYVPFEDGDADSKFELVTSDENEKNIQKAIKSKEDEFTVALAEKESEISKLNDEINELNDKYSSLENSYNELSEYKKEKELNEMNSKKDNLIEEFSFALTEDELQPIKDKLETYSVESLKTELDSILASKVLAEKKNEKFNLTDESSVKIEVAKKSDSKSRYAV